MISYEPPWAGAGRRDPTANPLNFNAIVAGQSGNFWNWYFIPQIVAFVITVSSIAELNRLLRPCRSRAGACRAT
jgi:hypothetical protein